MSLGSRRDMVLLGMAALVVRMAIVAAVPAGHASDMRGWMETSRHVVENGPGAAYSQPLQGNLYPPAFFYPLWLSGWLYQACCSQDFRLGTRALDVLMRVGPALADCLVAVLVYQLAALYAGRRLARLSGLAYALNPAVLTTSAWMSMIGDSYYLLMVLVSLLAMLLEHPAVALSSLVVAVLIKPQALAFAPLIGFLAFMRGRARQIAPASVFACLAGLVLCLPFLLGGTIRDLMRAAVRMAFAFPYMHVRADNLWYLLSGGRDPWGPLPPYDTDLFLGFVPYRDVGLLLFGVLYLVVLYWLLGRSRSESVIAGAALVSLGFFVLNTRMHVNYSFPAFALLCVLCASTYRLYKLVLVGVTVSSLLDWGVLERLLPGASPGALACAHLFNSGLCLLAFAALFVAVRNTVVSEPRRGSLLRRDVTRLGVVKWSLLAVGISLLVASIIAHATGLTDRATILSAARSGLLFGTASVLLPCVLWKTRDFGLSRGDAAPEC